VSYDYVLRVESAGECKVTRERILGEREVIESGLGVVVVDSIDAHPEGDAPGRATCRPFTPVHQS
jgi:hypothetical protein